MLPLRLLARALSVFGITGVGIILVDDHGRFLLNLRGTEPDVRLQRRWAILAGTIKHTETPEQATLREIREEIGHPVAHVHLVVSVSWPRPVYLYAAGLPVPPARLVLGEGTEHRLVTLDEVSRLSPRAPFLGTVLRAFARTHAYEASLHDARQT